MNKLIKSVKQSLPKDIRGYKYRKKQEVYIPYAEIGIECLTRNESEINLFFETVLRLLNIGVKDISEIADILGITYNIIKEVVVDMIEEKYVFTSENRLTITPKGKKALETRKLVEIQKVNINNIVINLITGEIKSLYEIKKHWVDINSVCLNEELIISKEFLDKNYSDLNKIFQKSQIDENVYLNKSVIKELYKILGIAYKNLIYTKSELLLYENEDNEDFQLIFKDDINEQYINCFYKQIKNDAPPCLENFFERNASFIKNDINNKKNEDENAYNITKELRAMLRSSEDNVEDDVYTKFFEKRYMLEDMEYKYYFQYFNEFEFEKLVIISNRLTKIIDTNLIESIALISKKKPIFIIYDASEYGVKKMINQIVEKCDKKNVILNTLGSVPLPTKICFFPFLLVDIKESISSIFNRPVSIKDALMNFNNKEVSKNIIDIEDKLNVIFEIKGRKDINKNYDRNNPMRKSDLR